MLASIMAKKYSVSSTHILIDIPIGSNGSKVKSRPEALRLKKHFEIIGKKLRKHVKVILTDGSQPIGNGIGPALEARDVLWLLKRDEKRPMDLEKKSIHMAAEIFKMVGIKDGRKKAKDILDSGKAYEKMKEIIKAQGGRVFEPGQISIGQFKKDINSKKAGVIAKIDSHLISRIARIAGAPKDMGAGVYLHAHKGDKISKGGRLFSIYSESRFKLKFAIEALKNSSPFMVR